MSEFKNKSITTKGMELLTKAFAGETLEFTKIELGSGNFTGDIGEVSKLIQLKQSLPITKISRKGSQVTLSTTLKIEDIAISFDWSEIGVYAKGKDGVEILYMYGYTENTSYISKESLNEKLIHVTVMVSNVAEVTAKIDDSLVYLTDEALKEHGVDQEAHKDIRTEVKALEEQINNIDISWQSIQGKPTTFPPQNHTHNEYLTTTQKGTFRQISDLGLTNTNFSTTDVGGNMYKLFSAMPNYCIVMDRLNATSLYTNLYASLLAKATTDLGLTAFMNNDIIIRFESGLGTNLSNKVTIRDNQSYKEYAFIYDRAGSKDEVSKIYQTFGEGMGGGSLIGTKMNYSYISTSVYLSSGHDVLSKTVKVPTLARISFRKVGLVGLTIIVDGTTICNESQIYMSTIGISKNYADNINYRTSDLEIPFKNSLVIKAFKMSEASNVSQLVELDVFYYTNE